MKKSKKPETKEALAIPPEAYDRTPRLQVTLTDESCWLTKFDDGGMPTITYPVSALDLANGFRNFGAATGLLPAETLWWTSRKGMTEIAIWLPPIKRTILWAAGRKVHKIVLPPLGFVWIGYGNHYGLFAAAQRPTSGRDMLYHAPLPNIHDNANVCPGDVVFPKCAADTISGAATLFWESHFNHDLSQGKLQNCANLFKDLQALSGARTFPINRLVPAIRVNDLIDGEQRIASLATNVRNQPNEEPDPEWDEEDDDA